MPLATSLTCTLCLPNTSLAAILVPPHAFQNTSKLTPLSLTQSFDGEVIEPDTLTNPEKRKNFDLMAFIGRHRYASPSYPPNTALQAHTTIARKSASPR